MWAASTLIASCFCFPFSPSGLWGHLRQTGSNPVWCDARPHAAILMTVRDNWMFFLSNCSSFKFFNNNNNHHSFFSSISCTAALKTVNDCELNGMFQYSLAPPSHPFELQQPLHERDEMLRSYWLIHLFLRHKKENSSQWLKRKHLLYHAGNYWGQCNNKLFLF